MCLFLRMRTIVLIKCDYRACIYYLKFKHDKKCLFLFCNPPMIQEEKRCVSGILSKKLLSLTHTPRGVYPIPRSRSRRTLNIWGTTLWGVYKGVRGRPSPVNHESDVCRVKGSRQVAVGGIGRSESIYSRVSLSPLGFGPPRLYKLTPGANHQNPTLARALSDTPHPDILLLLLV